LTLPKEEIILFVAMLTLVIGYAVVLLRQGEPKGKKEKVKGKNKVEWEDVGEEFKLFFYNVGKALNSLFKKK
jgi:hypothetical protein